MRVQKYDLEVDENVYLEVVNTGFQTYGNRIIISFMGNVGTELSGWLIFMSVQNIVEVVVVIP